MQNDHILDDFSDDIRMLLSSDEPADVVAKYFSNIEAEIAAARLRSEGIPCFLANATAQSVTPHLSTEIRLHVRPEDLQKARALLAESSEPGLDTKEDSITLMQALVTILAMIIGIVLATLIFGGRR
jgi:Putative prokaryotic signal transducing protein